MAAVSEESRLRVQSLVWWSHALRPSRMIRLCNISSEYTSLLSSKGYQGKDRLSKSNKAPESSTNCRACSCQYKCLTGDAADEAS